MVKIDFENLGIEKKRTIKIGNGEYEVSPLTGRDIALYSNVKKGHEEEMFLKLVYVTLKHIDDSVTMEHIESMPLNVFQNILKVILEINELN